MGWKGWRVGIEMVNGGGGGGLEKKKKKIVWCDWTGSLLPAPRLCEVKLGERSWSSWWWYCCVVFLTTGTVIFSFIFIWTHIFATWPHLIILNTNSTPVGLCNYILEREIQGVMSELACEPITKETIIWKRVKYTLLILIIYFPWKPNHSYSY